MLALQAVQGPTSQQFRVATADERGCSQIVFGGVSGLLAVLPLADVCPLDIRKARRHLVKDQTDLRSCRDVSLAIAVTALSVSILDCGAIVWLPIAVCQATSLERVSEPVLPMWGGGLLVESGTDTVLDPR